MAPPGERGAAPGGGCGAGAFWGNFCGIWGSLRSGAAVRFRQGLGLVPAGGFGVIPARFGVDFGRGSFGVISAGFGFGFGRVFLGLVSAGLGFGFGRVWVCFQQGVVVSFRRAALVKFQEGFWGDFSKF